MFSSNSTHKEVQSDCTIPTEDDIHKLSGLAIDDNTENEDPLKRSFMPKKTAKSMLLKAFSLRGRGASHAAESTIRSGSLRKTQRSKVFQELQTQPDEKSSMNAVDAYFMQHADTKSGPKNKTGNRTLSSLCTGSSDSGLPDPVKLERILKETGVKHMKIVSRLRSDIYTQLFPNWPIYLNEGFNLLLYGVGSKRTIIQDFRKKYLQHYNCIVVPGYEHSMNIRQILNTICHEFLQLSAHCQNPSDQLQAISDMFNKKDASKSPLYLLVHSIDGPGLRNAKAQSILAQLASFEHIHLVASLDHFNTVILWSHNELARFTWIWEDCTTLDDYKEEASYANSPILQNLLGGLAGGTGLATGGSGTILASLRQVAASLTQNARDIFRMVAEHQLNAPLHESRGDRVGMPLEDLYWRCRDAFLTNSEATLRVQLTEFRDHKLIKIKKSPDGTELLVIPMDNASLQKFLENFETFC